MTTTRELISDSINHRGEVRKTLPDTIKTLGLMEVFEACFDRCLEIRENKDDAVLFAHEIFLSAIQVYHAK